MEELATQTTSADGNAHRLERAYAGIAEGDIEPLLGLMAEGVRWTVAGSTEFSGTTQGVDEMLERIGRFTSRLAGPLSFEIQKMISAGDYVFVLANSSAPILGGGEYKNRYCNVFRFSGRQVIEVEEFLDTQSLAAVSAVEHSTQ